MRWGVLGCGAIANDFVCALKGVEGAHLQAVAARSLDRAKEFAATHNFTSSYGSYAELASDPQVDVVYVATIHPEHYSNTMLCLEHGKHVLVEKPIAINAAQAEKMIAKARENKLFLMEGMWTRFMPAALKARELVNGGAIGDIVSVEADFGICVPRAAAPRLFERDMGGGGLLDVGCYPLGIASWMFGGDMPAQITAVGVLDAQSKVDLCGTLGLKYKAGIASLLWSINSETTETTKINGTKGVVCLEKPAHSPDTCVLLQFQERASTTKQVFHFPHPPKRDNKFNFPASEAFEYQAKAVEKCLNDGKLECDLVPLDESLIVMRIMDEARKQIGVVYPWDIEA